MRDSKNAQNLEQPPQIILEVMVNLKLINLRNPALCIFPLTIALGLLTHGF